MRKIIVAIALALSLFSTGAKAATANFNDMQTLMGDPVFGNRVLIALVQYCIVTVAPETPAANGAQVHSLRKNYCANVLNNQTAYKSLFVTAAAVNQIVANEATASGSIVGQTGATLATSALLCLDADIQNAVASALNAFIGGIN